MGEISEMMEEGILCQVCGVYLNIDHEFEKNDDNFQGTGHWTTCRACSKDNLKSPWGCVRKQKKKVRPVSQHVSEKDGQSG